MTRPSLGPRVVAGRAALVLDGTASPRLTAAHEAPSATVLTFWLQFRNHTGETLALAAAQTSFTDDRGVDLEYDEAPVTVVGRTDRVAPGAGFVTVARHTVECPASSRLIRNEILVTGTTGDGHPLHHRAGIEVLITPSSRCSVRFTPMIVRGATRRVIYARRG